MPTPPPLLSLFPGGGRIHLLGGSNHSGKSTLVAQLCQALLSGSPLFSFPSPEPLPPSHLFVVFCDRTQADNMEWLAKLPVQPTIFSLVDDPEYVRLLKSGSFERGISIGAKNPVSGFHQFEWLLKRLSPPPGSILLLDVFSNVFVGRDIQENGEVRANMIAIGDLARSRNLTLIGTCYGVKIQGDKKSRYARLIDRLIGGASFRGCASTIAYITTPEEAAVEDYPIPSSSPDLSSERIQVLEIVPRSGPPHTVFIARTQTGFFAEVNQVAVDIAAVAPEGINKRAVKECLGAGPLTLQSLHQLLGTLMSKETLRQTLSRMCDSGSILRVGRGLYALPEGEEPLPKES